MGRITHNGNLVVDHASNLPALEKKLAKHLLEFEEISNLQFVISYDLTAFFVEHSYLNISDIAAKAEINPALMRQYVAGIKFPSASRVKDIEKSIRAIGKELAKTNLHKTKRTAA